jgi:hypothetical protein
MLLVFITQILDSHLSKILPHFMEAEFRYHILILKRFPIGDSSHLEQILSLNISIAERLLIRVCRKNIFIHFTGHEGP